MSPEQPPQVMLVDSDPVLCQTVAAYLQSHGFNVVVQHDGEAGFRHATEGAYDLVILGDIVSGLTGGEVLRRIRQQGEVPVVMLSSKSDDIECIVNLELGADDCLRKSCNLRELTARLRTILRRSRHLFSEKTTRLRLSPTERRATWCGKPLQLTSSEFNVLEVLFSDAGRTISKQKLATSALGRELRQFDRTLDMHISNLRKKLGKLADGRSPIQTVSRAGYQLLRL